jgi:hypothetical protein
MILKLNGNLTLMTLIKMHSKDQLLLLLKGPEHYAHKTGQQMANLLNQRKRRKLSDMHKEVDKHLNIMMQIFDTEQNVRIIKTWLTLYELPLDASKLNLFDKWHDTHCDFVMDNCSVITPYGK